MASLLNWLVQGTVVVALVAAAMRLFRWRHAALRYRAWQLTLALVLAQPVASLAWQALANGPALATRQSHVRDTATAGPLQAVPASVSLPSPLLSLPAPLGMATRVFVAVATVWLLLHLGLLCRDVWVLHRMRRRCAPLDADLVARVPAATRLLLARSGVRLVASDDVRAAAALGLGRPLIALQPRVAAKLTDAELHQTVLHEWAHVERGDLGLSLLERLVQAAVGWHPAILWVLRTLRRERELACDETVVATAGSGRAYAALLTRLATLCAHHTPPNPRLAAHAVSSGLARRVAHALTVDALPRQTSAFRRVAAATTLAVVALGGSTVAIFGMPVQPTVSAVLHVLAASAQDASASLVTLDVVPVVPVAPARSSLRSSGSSRRPSVGSPAATPSLDSLSAVVETAATGTLSPDRTTQQSPAPPSDDRAPDATDRADDEKRPATTGQHAAAEPQPLLDAPPVPPSVSAPAHDLVNLSTSLARESGHAWTKAADAGTAIGRQSQDSATAAARFFTRFGKRVASSVSSF